MNQLEAISQGMDICAVMKLVRVARSTPNIMENNNITHREKHAHLSMKQGNLFCFVCHTEISQTMVLHGVLLVSLESS